MMGWETKELGNCSTNIMYDMDGKILQARQAGEEVVYTFNTVDENGNRSLLPTVYLQALRA